MVKEEFWNELQTEFLQIITKDSANIKAKLGLAQSYFGKGNFSTAAVVLEELISQDPNNFDAQFLMCRIHMAENNLSEAVKTYQRAKARYAGQYPIYVELGSNPNIENNNTYEGNGTNQVFYEN